MTNTENTENTESTESLFDGGEFVLMQNEGKEIVGGGYKINSFFLKEGKSPITTYNNPNQHGNQVSCQLKILQFLLDYFYYEFLITKKILKHNINHMKWHLMI